MVTVTGTSSKGGRIENLILDGGPSSMPAIGLSLLGLNTGCINQNAPFGVIGFNLKNIRARNITAIGFLFDYAQSGYYEHLIVSKSIDPNATMPTHGIQIGKDNFCISNANTFANIQIEHTTGDGVVLFNAGATSFLGGTSEGNTGWGFVCAGQNGTNHTSSSSDQYAVCQGNTFVSVDTEQNTSGDYIFSTLGNANSIINSISSSSTGIVFTAGATAAQNNLVIGGNIGPSRADTYTIGNRLVAVGVGISGLSTTNCAGVWTDNGGPSGTGANSNDSIVNFTNGVTVCPEANNIPGAAITATQFNLRYNKNSLAVANMSSTPTNDADMSVTVTNPDATKSWLGISLYHGSAQPWLHYRYDKGFQFISDNVPCSIGPTFLCSGADGSVVNHNFGWGRYMTQPQYPVHIKDTAITTVGVEQGSNQGAFPLLKFLSNCTSVNSSTGACNYDNTISNVDSSGKFNGPTNGTHTGAFNGSITGGSITKNVTWPDAVTTGLAGTALCIKPTGANAGTFGYCTNIQSNGTCTCN
jgi:hypothetical protein